VVLPDDWRCDLNPWLSFSCPACGQWGSVDLRTLERHPGASISSLVPPSVSCRRCSPNASFARLEALTAERALNRYHTKK
jgi:hypothetical protein